MKTRFGFLLWFALCCGALSVSQTPSPVTNPNTASGSGAPSPTTTPTPTPSPTPIQSLLPTNWKGKVPDIWWKTCIQCNPDLIDTFGFAENRRSPVLQGFDPALGNNQVGYEFRVCGNSSFSVGRSVVLSRDCDESSDANRGFRHDYGRVPTTAFAVDASYRFTMSQIGPFLEDMEKRINTLSSKDSIPWKAVESSVEQNVNDSFQQRMDDLVHRVELLEAALKELQRKKK